MRIARSYYTEDGRLIAKFDPNDEPHLMDAPVIECTMIDYENVEQATIRVFFRDCHEFFDFNDAMNAWHLAEQLYADKFK